MNLLECQNLTKAYGTKTVLDNVTLEVSSGKIIGLLGQNGVGKSTFLKILNGLLTPTSGKVLIDGQPIGVYTKSIVSYLPERTYLDKTMRIHEVLVYFSEFYHDFDSQRAEKILSNLNLNGNQQISKMSKGMQEKLQLALVMSRQAKLYLLDEPLGGVDPATRDYILDTILSNFNREASIIISTHLVADIERILDHVIFLNHGKIVINENADQLRNRTNLSIDNLFRETFHSTKI